MLDNEVIQKIERQVESRVKGKHFAVKLTLVGLIARGHILIEDVPGVGKTLLAMTLARSLGCKFQRVQCTSDLLPSDILGVSIYNQKSGSFDFKPGPIFTHVLLVDEINRSTPKTQSALLEAMSDRHVSVDNQTLALPDPFLVVATQNPVEHQGTYPLPEAQKDRFMLRIRMGYPDRDSERAILSNGYDQTESNSPESVISVQEILKLQQKVHEVGVEATLMEYVLSLVAASRSHEAIKLGLSTRGALHLITAAKAHALLGGRDYLIAQDIVELAPHVMGHRLIPKFGLHQSTSTQAIDHLVSDIIASVPVPR